MVITVVLLKAPSFPQWTSRAFSQLSSNKTRWRVSSSCWIFALLIRLFISVCWALEKNQLALRCCFFNQLIKHAADEFPLKLAWWAKCDGGPKQNKTRVWPGWILNLKRVTNKKKHVIRNQWLFGIRNRFAAIQFLNSEILKGNEENGGKSTNRGKKFQKSLKKQTWNFENSGGKQAKNDEKSRKKTNKNSKIQE